MKNQLFITAFAACLTIALAAPITAPADPIVGQVSAPVAKTKRVVPPALPIDRAISAPRSVTATPRLTTFIGQATIDACVYDDDYSMGATNTGTTFCTRQLAYQTLPEPRLRKTSAANVPPGYILSLYARNGNNDLIVQCELHGPRPALGPWCNDLAEGISIRRATQADMDAATARENELRDFYYRLKGPGEGFAPDIARRAKAEAEAKRVAAERHAAQVEAFASFVRENANCVLDVLASDNWALLGRTGRQCYNESLSSLGDVWNDDFEIVGVGTGRSSRAVVTLYEHVNYQGRSLRLTCGNYELIGDVENEVSSLKIEMLSAPVACPARGVRSERHYWDPG
jgi:hypothetical protein